MEKDKGNSHIHQIRDILDQVQEEITAVRGGTLDESRARVIFRGRQVQLKVAELMLQHARLVKGIIPKSTQLLLSGQVVEAPPVKHRRKSEVHAEKGN